MAPILSYSGRPRFLSIASGYSSTFRLQCCPQAADESMTTPTARTKPAPETHLQRTLNAALNDMAADSALAAVFHQENGPLLEHAARSFTPRDVQAIIRTLSAHDAVT